MLRKDANNLCDLLEAKTYFNDFSVRYQDENSKQIKCKLKINRKYFFITKSSFLIRSPKLSFSIILSLFAFNEVFGRNLKFLIIFILFGRLNKMRFPNSGEKTKPIKLNVKWFSCFYVGAVNWKSYIASKKLNHIYEKKWVLLGQRFGAMTSIVCTIYVLSHYLEHSPVCVKLTLSIDDDSNGNWRHTIFRIDRIRILTYSAQLPFSNYWLELLNCCL